jgi:hypothetical protein
VTTSQRIACHLRGNLVGYVALFVALSGTAIALPGKGTVKSDDLARNAVKAKAIKSAAVTNAKLGSNAVTSGKVADGSVIGVDLGSEVISRDKIQAGSINGGKLANGSVNSPKVNDGSLKAEDFAPGELGDGFVQEADPAIFNLPRGGEVFVNSTFTTTCATPPCDYQLTVDGNSINGTAVIGDFNQQLTLTGVTGTLTAGNHTFDIVPSTDATATDPTIAAVLLQ